MEVSNEKPLTQKDIENFSDWLNGAIGATLTYASPTPRRRSCILGEYSKTKKITVHFVAIHLHHTFQNAPTKRRMKTPA